MDLEEKSMENLRPGEEKEEEAESVEYESDPEEDKLPSVRLRREARDDDYDEVGEEREENPRQDREKEEDEEHENVEYESDPEERTLPSVRRRREASDDEDGEGDGEERERNPDRFDSGSESDGQGGVEEEIEDEVEEEDEEEEEEIEEEELEEVKEGEGGYDAGETEVGTTEKKGNWNDWGSDGEQTVVNENNQVDDKEIDEKEKEPFAVPTAGAFYMHDDRFGDSTRNRRHISGGRKLWETKDNQKWGHDKFEEMNSRQTSYGKDKRTSRGRYSGHVKNRDIKSGNVGENRYNAHDNRANQNHTSRVVKGRGPRRYKSPATTNNGSWPTRYNESRKSHVTTSNNASGRVSAQNLNVQSDPAVQRKHVFASSLNSASPPFYPSGSTDSGPSPINVQKRDGRVGNTNRNVQSSLELEENYSAPQSKAFLQGKAVGNPNDRDKFYNDKPISQVSAKMANLQMQSFGSSPKNTHSRSQGRGSSVKGLYNYQPTSSRNQDNKVYVQTQLPVVQQRPVRNPVQPSLRNSSEQFGQYVGGESQSSSPHTQSGNSSESGESELPPGSSRSAPALDGKGKNIVHGSGRGPFLFNGAHVFGAGNMGIAHGDHNFPATPTLFQVMQFGGQHPSGLGVPAVGMTLPGSVPQPQHGFANPEMTWLPPLAAAALGAAYSPSYMAVDDGYSGHPSGQASALGISSEFLCSRETSSNKHTNGWKPSERPESVTDEFAQRQNKPRRYSEMNMNFGQ